MIADENGLSEETRHVRCPRDPKRGCVWRITDEDRSDDVDHLLYSQAGRSEQLSSTTSGKRKQAKIPLWTTEYYRDTNSQIASIASRDPPVRNSVLSVRVRFKTACPFT